MVYSEFIPSRETAITLHELARAIPGGVALDGGSNVSMPIAIYERGAATIGSVVVSERSQAFSIRRSTTIDSTPSLPRELPQGLIPRQFKGNESFVKFQGASHAVVYSDLRPRQKFLRSCDMITLTVDGASEEK